MNRSPAIEAFYSSKTWRKCRQSFAESKGNLCEKCLQRGVIEPGSKQKPLEVHHKIRITEDNIKDPSITLNWSNLMLLCEKCHHEEHEKRKDKRWRIDEDGRVLI